MAKKLRITVAPKKVNRSVMDVSLREQVKEAEKEERKKVYNPRVRLTAHVKRK